jgi:hypothetical protein
MGYLASGPGGGSQQFVLDSPKRLPLGCADVSISAGPGIYTCQGISICKR